MNVSHSFSVSKMKHPKSQDGHVGTNLGSLGVDRKVNILTGVLP